MSVDAEQVDLSGLRALAALAEGGSLLRAARRTGVPRTTFRRRLEALEAVIGVPLFLRVGDSVQLTPAGVVLVERADILLHSVRDVIEEARQASAAPLRSIRLLLPVGMPPQLFLAGGVFRAQQYPELHVDIRFSSDPFSEELSGYDVILFIGDVPERGRFVTRKVSQLTERLVATRQYLDTFGTPQEPAELAGHTLLTWTPPGEDPRCWPMAAAALEVEPVCVSPDIHLLRLMALAHQGIARIPEAVAPGLGGEGLVPVLPEFFSRTTSMRLLIPEGLSRTSRVRKLVALLDSLGIQ